MRATAEPDRTDAGGLVARRFALLADTEFRDHSPLYERLARRLAEDPVVPAALASLTAANQAPVKLFAAVHRLLLDEPDHPLARIYRGEPGDPWPPFRELLATRWDEVGELVRTRSIQTNEVGRTAGLVPALGVIAAELGEPLAVVEIGASAGLNLRFDRYAVDYGRSGRIGPAGAAVELACDVVGPLRPPLREAPPAPWRVGVDLTPVDVRDPEQCRWLEACVWPDTPGRLEQLRAALADARRDPPPVRRGDAVTELPGLLAEAPPGTVPVVVSTWALAYLTPEARRSVYETVAAAGNVRDVALVTVEYPQVTPWVPAPSRAAAAGRDRGASLLGLATWQQGVARTRPLAWMQAHGRWIDWLDPPSVRHPDHTAGVAG
jgi:hypothetical protein